ncbi:hypothetical protein [Bacillus sp. SM2101]|uniref:hypothetical protein n=1 Tax=Bacillus sp. SM2101 TaxID=2805366 RepID=UPI001BDE52F8|nr:hypothetical protein [Bacillus sp. SM2101]
MGYQTVKVYYDEEDRGKEEFLAGKYVHNWQIIANDISIGPATIDIFDGFTNGILRLTSNLDNK